MPCLTVVLRNVPTFYAHRRADFPGLMVGAENRATTVWACSFMMCITQHREIQLAETDIEIRVKLFQI